MPVAGQHDVHVGARPDVFFVAEVKARLTIDDPDAHRGDTEATSAASLPSERDGIHQGDVRTGDGRGPGTAVGDQDVAVDGDGVFAESFEIDALDAASGR